MEQNSRYNDPPLEKVEWFARKIFDAWPKLTGLRLYTLDCGCIYYERVFPDGTRDMYLGLYRASIDGPCDACMPFQIGWRARVVDETVVYNYEVQVESER